MIYDTSRLRTAIVSKTDALTDRITALKETRFTLPQYARDVQMAHMARIIMTHALSREPYKSRHFTYGEKPHAAIYASCGR
jgi:hypothetical protein